MVRSLLDAGQWRQIQLLVTMEFRGMGTTDTVPKTGLLSCSVWEVPCVMVDFLGNSIIS